MNKNGVTLIELLVVMVIAAITMAGIYRVFIGQTKTYAIQDQVMEVQQSVRGAMEIMLRDLRMTGFDDDNPASVAAGITVPTAIGTPLADHSITINYEYFDRNVGASGQYQRHTVVYSVNANSQLTRQLTKTLPGGGTQGPTTEPILPNVSTLNFTYGIDANSDGIMDDQNGNGQIDANDWRTAAQVGTTRVVAINVTLTGRPDQTNVDVSKVVSPRTLVSTVTLRNLSLR